MIHIQNTNAVKISEALGKTMSPMLTWPFDMAHTVYALAVRAGLLKDSILASSRFSRQIGALEKMLLGSWARRA